MEVQLNNSCIIKCARRAILKLLRLIINEIGDYM